MRTKAEIETMQVRTGISSMMRRVSKEKIFHDGQGYFCKPKCCAFLSGTAGCDYIAVRAQGIAFHSTAPLLAPMKFQKPSNAQKQAVKDYIGFAPPPPANIASNEKGNFLWAPSSEIDTNKVVEKIVADVNNLLPIDHKWYSVVEVYDALPMQSRQNIRHLYKRIDKFFLTVEKLYEMDQTLTKVRRRPIEDTSHSTGAPRHGEELTLVDDPYSQQQMAARYEISQQPISQSSKKKKKKKMNQQLERAGSPSLATMGRTIPIHGSSPLPARPAGAPPIIHHNHGKPHDVAAVHNHQPQKQPLQKGPSGTPPIAPGIYHTFTPPQPPPLRKG